jgi:uncharacterized protein YbjT (DUF2867 family)
MIAPTWVSMPTQPIALTDVVACLAGVAGHDGAIGETFDLGGPDVLTDREMIERIAALRVRRRAIVEVPILSPRLSSYWLHLVTPVRAGVARLSSRVCATRPSCARIASVSCCRGRACHSTLPPALRSVRCRRPSQ